MFSLTRTGRCALFYFCLAVPWALFYSGTVGVFPVCPCFPLFFLVCFPRQGVWFVFIDTFFVLSVWGHVEGGFLCLLTSTTVLSLTSYASAGFIPRNSCLLSRIGVHASRGGVQPSSLQVCIHRGPGTG